MGTIISKDTRRISFDNTISINPILIRKSCNDFDDIVIDDFDEINKCLQKSSCKLNLKENTKYTRMDDEDQHYWAHRIDRLKNEHQIINNIIEKEYEKNIEKNDKIFEPQIISKEKNINLKSCLDWRSKLLQCYEDNSRQPLLCSAVVEAFTKCVTSCQLKD